MMWISDVAEWLASSAAIRNKNNVIQMYENTGSYREMSVVGQVTYASTEESTF